MIGRVDEYLRLGFGFFRQPLYFKILEEFPFDFLLSQVFIIQAMGISSFVAGIGLLIFPYINSLVSKETFI